MLVWQAVKHSDCCGSLSCKNGMENVYIADFLVLQAKKKKKVSGQVMSFDKPCCDWNFKGVMIWQTYVTMTLHAPTLPPHPPPPTIIPVPLFKPLNCLPLVSVYNCKYHTLLSLQNLLHSTSSLYKGFVSSHSFNAKLLTHYILSKVCLFSLFLFFYFLPVNHFVWCVLQWSALTFDILSLKKIKNSLKTVLDRA